MIQGIIVVLALLLAWVGLRLPPPHGPSRLQRPFGWVDTLACALLMLAHLPQLRLLLASAALPGFLPGDARSHALVARRLFEHGLASGWIDSYLGGFPAAVHYPLLGWLLIGLPMSLGASPVHAVNATCFGCVVATPLLAYWVTRRLGAAAFPSFAACLLLTWVSPLNPFVGSSETYFQLGLVSQCVAMPLLLLWLGGVLRPSNLGWAMFWANLSFLAHPQVALSATAVMATALLLNGERRLLGRFAVSLGSALVVAALVYGQGMRHLTLPFGWPPLPQWMQVGFGPDRLGDWLVDGKLLDEGRAPVFTGLWLGALVLVAVRAKQPIARAALAASVLVLALSVMGPALRTTGALGALALKVLQPLRTLSLVPLVAAATVLVALELHREPLQAAASIVERLLRFRPGSAAHWRLVAPCLLALALAAPMAASHWRNAAERIAAIRASASHGPCGPNGPTSAEIAALRVALRNLHGGRLWIDPREGSLSATCAVMTGFELDAAVPLAGSHGVGGHVGFALQVARGLSPAQAGLDQRAEVLGIRHLLVNQPLAGANAESFELTGEFGSLFLYSRRGGSQLFGVGCTRQQRVGSNSQLEKSLLADLESDDRRATLFEPTSLTALALTGSPPTDSSATSACSADHAQLSDERHENAQHSASLQSPSPVELVLKVTAYPSWRWTLDGTPIAPRLVFPGYYAVAVPAGEHRVQVATQWSPWVLFALTLAWLGPLAMAVALHRLQRRRLSKQ